MNLTDYWQSKVNEWNQESKCGFCYTFHAPTLESSVNKTNIEDCCVNVFMVNDYIDTTNIKLNETFGQHKATECVYGFTLFFLKQTNLGQNIYNEQKEYPISESLRKELIEPLMNCFSCKNYECNDVEGYKGYKKWRIEPVIKKYDSTYSGIKITAEIIIDNE